MKNCITDIFGMNWFSRNNFLYEKFTSNNKILVIHYNMKIVMDDTFQCAKFTRETLIYENVQHWCFSISYFSIWKTLSMINFYIILYDVQNSPEKLFYTKIKIIFYMKVSVILFYIRNFSGYNFYMIISDVQNSLENLFYTKIFTTDIILYHTFPYVKFYQW